MHNLPSDSLRIASITHNTDSSRCVSTLLKDKGHMCYAYETDESAIKALQKESFDIVILDWTLHNTGGEKILHWIRQNMSWHIPVLVLSEDDNEQATVAALDGGADDYISQPTRHAELVARIQALGRRITLGKNRISDYGVYRFDLEKHTLEREGKVVKLTEKEFELASFIFRNAGRVLSRHHLLETVWGRSAELNTRTVDTHISRLRKKLELTPESSGWHLNAIYQHGYRLERRSPLERRSRALDPQLC